MDVFDEFDEILEDFECIEDDFDESLDDDLDTLSEALDESIMMMDFEEIEESIDYFDDIVTEASGSYMEWRKSTKSKDKEAKELFKQAKKESNPATAKALCDKSIKLYEEIKTEAKKIKDNVMTGAAMAGLYGAAGGVVGATAVTSTRYKGNPASAMRQEAIIYCDTQIKKIKKYKSKL